MVSPAHHATRDELSAFVLGLLLDERATVVEQHVSECDLCCQTLLEITAEGDTFVDLLRHSAEAPLTSPAGQPGHDAVTRDELLDHPRYEVETLVGAGGMGNVYRAKHRVMDRTVALKVIHQRFVNDRQASERFQREVKAAAKLDHPNIVTAFDAEREGNSHFLIIEYVEGSDLGKVVSSSGRLPIEKACDYILQAACGLQHAHEQGMVHRDIKPQNLMLTPDGVVKILDFGLASLCDPPVEQDAAASPPTANLTSIGAVVGTPDYIAPEQAVDAHSADARSDIYSLGATFYFLLAGRPPFAHGSVEEKLQHHAKSEIEPIESLRPDTPSGVARIVERMTAKRPSDRFQNANQVAEALRELPIRRPVPPTSPKKRPVYGLAVIATTVVICVVVGAALYFGKQGGAQVADRTPNHGASSSTDQLTKPVDSPKQRDAQDTHPDQKEDASSASASSPPAAKVDLALESMKFVSIPIAQFTMGTPVASKAAPSERRHDVLLTRPFEMGAHEVTQQQFEWVMGNNPSRFRKGLEHGAVIEDTDTAAFPVESVSYEDAVEFCRRLSDGPRSKELGYAYRLPTEAEWEFACRGGAATTFHFGNTLNGQHANVDGEHPWGTNTKGPSQKQPVPVGSYQPNAYGLHDMHGNVWEWCSDWYTLDYYRQSPKQDPHGPDTGTTRVVRGGAWDYGAFYARSSARDQREPSYRDANLGFRVVRTRRPSAP